MRRTLLLLFTILSFSCGGAPEQASSGAGGSSAASTSNTSSASTSAGSGGGQSGTCTGLTKGPGDYDEVLPQGTTMRTFHVHVPSSYSPAARTSVVFVFHGYTQTAAGIEQISQMTPVSDKHGFITVYPQGLSNSWNAGSCCGTAASTKVDDLKFVSDMIDKLSADYCVDPKRVFAAGLSNGGMLSHRLACEMSDRIAAIGPVAGTLAIPTCAPPRPVAVMHVHGTGDLVVPYNGGGLAGAKSVPDTITAWTKQDACTDAMPTNVYLKADASCDEYQMCGAGTAVRLCTIDQGGHQWPGGTDDFLGKLSLNLDSSEEMAKFFEAHPMP